MLSTQEIDKIKEGVATIRKELPEAEPDVIIRMFNFVFGDKLTYSDRAEAERLIKSEWENWLI